MSEHESRVMQEMFRTLKPAQRRAIGRSLLEQKKAFAQPDSTGHEVWFPVWVDAVKTWNQLVDTQSAYSV